MMCTFCHTETNYLCTLNKVAEFSERQRKLIQKLTWGGVTHDQAPPTERDGPNVSPQIPQPTSQNNTSLFLVLLAADDISLCYQERWGVTVGVGGVLEKHRIIVLRLKMTQKCRDWYRSNNTCLSVNDLSLLFFF